MLKQGYFRIALLSVASFVSVPALAQGGAAPGGGLNVQQGPDGQITINGMDIQQVRQTVQTSIQQSGIDMQKVQQEMQNGTFNPSNYQQQINQITGQMSQVLGVDLSQMQNRMQNANLDSLKIQLGADDLEWAVLLPRIQKVVAASNSIPSSNNVLSRSAMMMGAGGRNQAQTPLQKIDSDMRNLVNDPNSSNATIAQKLKDYRAATDQAVKELRAAEKDLSELLTPRQEGILVNLGYMK